MHFLIKSFVLVLLILSFLPALAYNSGDAIVITRKAPVKKALLDHKFIFMQEVKAPITNMQRSTELSNYSIKSLVPVKSSTENSQKRIIIQHPSSSTEPAKDNWDAYVEEVPVELEENLGVEAKLVGVH